MIPIFEDNHLLVLNKPAGLLTQPSGTDQTSLEQQAKVWLKIKYAKPGNVFLEAVHRLDKPVSGVVVFGKTSKALQRLNESIRSKATQKTYIAGVEGFPPVSMGELKHYLVHDDHCAQIVNAAHPQAKLAKLTYKVIEEFKQDTLIEIDLETGRYHQIRVQLAQGMRCPIWGDRRYDSHRLYKPECIALHHKRLVIPHPITKELLVFEAPLPANFKIAGL